MAATSSQLGEGRRARGHSQLQTATPHYVRHIKRDRVPDSSHPPSSSFFPVLTAMTEIVASQTPPILHGPTDKEKKYDRQLRLWAASGQDALESANLLLVNSGSGVTGVEALKNLVLPGTDSVRSIRCE